MAALDDPRLWVGKRNAQMADNTLKGKRILGTARPPKANSEQRTASRAIAKHCFPLQPSRVLLRPRSHQVPSSPRPCRPRALGRSYGAL